jgi:hypothetical protein
VLAHVDTEQAHNELVNSRLAYVSVSRGRGESCPVSRIPCPGAYANDAGKLGKEFSRDVSEPSAIENNGAGRGKKSGATPKVLFQYPTVWRRPKSTVWPFIGHVDCFRGGRRSADHRFCGPRLFLPVMA